MPEAYLTSVANVKTYMGINVSTYDAVIAMLIKTADQYIRTHTNRPDGFLETTFAEKLSGNDGKYVTLTYTPVNTNKSFSVSIDGSAVASSQYTFNPATGILMFSADNWEGWTQGYAQGLPTPLGRNLQPRWSAGNRNITVSYTGGWSAIDATPGPTDPPVVPFDLQQACIEIVKILFQSRLRDYTLKGETLGQYSYDGMGYEGIRAAYQSVMDTMLGAYVRHPVLGPEIA